LSTGDNRRFSNVCHPDICPRADFLLAQQKALASHWLHLPSLELLDCLLHLCPGHSIFSCHTQSSSQHFQSHAKRRSRAQDFSAAVLGFSHFLLAHFFTTPPAPSVVLT